MYKKHAFNKYLTVASKTSGAGAGARTTHAKMSDDDFVMIAFFALFDFSDISKFRSSLRFL